MKGLMVGGNEQEASQDDIGRKRWVGTQSLERGSPTAGGVCGDAYSKKGADNGKDYDCGNRDDDASFYELASWHSSRIGRWDGGSMYYQLHAFKAEKTGFMVDETNDSVLDTIKLSLCEE